MTDEKKPIGTATILLVPEIRGADLGLVVALSARLQELALETERVTRDLLAEIEKSEIMLGKPSE